MTNSHTENDQTNTFAFITGFDGDGPISLRLLRLDSMAGWVMFPKSKALPAFLGELALPEFAGQTVDVAEARVEMMNHKPFRLMRLARSEWQFDDDGKIDAGAEVKRIADLINGPPGDRGQLDDKRAFSVDDIISIRRVLGVTEL